ncbi:MAG: hypothetical protein U0R51_04660 [Solirubrobacterales bacterium]
MLQTGDEIVAVDNQDRVAGLPPEKLAETVRDQVATHKCEGEPTDSSCEGPTASTPEDRARRRAAVRRIKPVYDAPEAVPGQPAVEPRMAVGFGYEQMRETVPPGQGRPASPSTASGT